MGMLSLVSQIYIDKRTDHYIKFNALNPIFQGLSKALHGIFRMIAPAMPLDHQRAPGKSREAFLLVVSDVMRLFYYHILIFLI